MVGIEQMTMFRGVLMQSALGENGISRLGTDHHFLGKLSTHLGISAADFGKAVLLFDQYKQLTGVMIVVGGRRSKDVSIRG
jgi:hypothetical protein